MSRPAAAVYRVIKAYDVRGLVGEELDEQFVREIGGAFARLMRDENATQVVIGHDMRDSSPSLARGLRRGRRRAGPRCGAHRPGVHRSAVFRLGPAGLPRCHVHRKPQPGRLQRHQALSGRRQARRQGHGSHRDQRGRHRRGGCPRGAPRLDVRSRCPGRLRRVPAVVGEPGRVAAAEGRRRCGQRYGRPHHSRCAGIDSDRSRWLRCSSNSTATFPNHEANPLDPANLVDLQAYVLETGADIGLAFDGDADRCFVVDE